MNLNATYQHLFKKQLQKY